MDRTQKVVLHGYTLLYLELLAQVFPRDLFLFLSYFYCINDTSYDIANNLPLSADDNSLYIIVDKCMKTATNSQTLDQDKISEWHLWAIDYNPSKTENLDFDRKKTPFSPPVIWSSRTDSS